MILDVLTPSQIYIFPYFCELNPKFPATTGQHDTTQNTKIFGLG